MTKPMTVSGQLRYPAKRHVRSERKRRSFTEAVVTYASLAALATIAFAAEEKIYAHDHQLSIRSHGDLQQISLWTKRRRGRRKNTCIVEKNQCTNLPLELRNAMSLCRGGDMGSSAKSKPDTFSVDQDSEDLDINDNGRRISSQLSSHPPSGATLNAYGKTNSVQLSSELGSDWTKEKRIQLASMLESSGTEEPQPQTHQSSSFIPRPRLVIEFDTQAVDGIGQGTGIRHRIRNRIGTDNEWHRLPHRGPALSVSLDAFPPPPTTQKRSNGYGDAVPQQCPPKHASNVGNNGQTLRDNLLVPTKIAIALIIQTAALLPSLVLSRRALNSTWTAIVDYFRGRIFRTTFTKLESAYMRYYEFPAATRATARLVSQIGILLGLSWLVRWWMILVFMGNGVGPMLLGVTGIDIGIIGTSSERQGAIGPGWKVGLPCHQRGKGMAWLCGLIWIGAVVGIGHLGAMALSVWGGPLRLQACAQQAENPKHVLKRIILHPIIWIRELDEWKHFSSLRNGSGKDRRAGERQFNPDPLLFPATWLPLRWLQIFAVAKAFSTDPLKYRWCSPEDDKVVIPRLMKQYLVQLALGDEWHRVCLGEKRVGLGIMVVSAYFIALLVMVFTAFTLDGGAAAMLIPSVLAAIITGFMNIMIFWNRMGTKEQRRALSAMGLA